MRIEFLLDDFCLYASSIKGYSQTTIRRYKANFRLFMKRTHIGDIELVTPDVVRTFFVQGRTEYAWSPATFLTYYKSLKVFFAWCVKEKHLAENPIGDLEKPRLEKKLPKHLTQQDALKVLEIIYNYPYDYSYLRYRNHAIFAMFIFAGLRKTELLTLGFGDVDLENRSILVRQGKGNKDRVIPMCSKLVNILGRYIDERKRLKKMCPQFFTSLQGDRGFTDAGWKHLLEQAREALGMKFSAHKLRHTFATLLLEGGCDIYSLSKMMGHSQIQTTTIYLAASLEHLRGQIRKHPLNGAK